MKPPSDHSDPLVKRAVLLLSLAAFGSALSQRVVDPLLPRLSSEFHQPLSVVAWIITSFTIGYALCQLLSGPLGDRYGKYLMIARTTFASSVATLLCAVSPNLPLLLGARALSGAMVAGIIPLSLAWLGDMVPYQERQPVLARYLIGLLLGTSAGQLLGGLSADYFGWRVPFALITLVFAITAAGLFAIHRKLPAEPTASTVDGRRTTWREFALVLARPWARVVLLTVTIEGAFVFGAFAFFATHIHRQLHVSLTTSGSLVMLFGMGGFIFALTSRRILAILGETGLACVGGIIMSLSLAAVALTPGLWWVGLASLTFGIGFYMLHNTLQTNATQMAPERRGTAVSAFAMCYFIGQSAGVALIGWLVARIATATVICGAALGVLTLALVFARAKARHSTRVME